MMHMLMDNKQNMPRNTTRISVYAESAAQYYGFDVLCTIMHSTRQTKRYMYYLLVLPLLLGSSPIINMELLAFEEIMQTTSCRR